MHELLSKITSDASLWPALNAYLPREWPQLNYKTEVKFSHQTALIIAEFAEINLFEGAIRKPIQVWNRLCKIAMAQTLETLDDPIARAIYHRELFHNFFRAIRLTFWRIIGTLFKRQDWYNRSTELSLNPIMPKPFQRRLEWKHFQFFDGRNRQCSMSFSYDSLHDTLYIFEYGGGR